MDQQLIGILIKSVITQEDKYNLKQKNCIIKIKLGSQQQQTKASSQKGKYPEWNQELTFDYQNEKDIEFSLYEENGKTQGNSIGKGKLDIQNLLDEKITGQTLVDLKNEKNEQIGQLNVSVNHDVDSQQADYQNKISDIQTRLNNIQLKLNTQPTTGYFQQTVHAAILEGMKIIGKQRPPNPVKELGLFLINYDQNQQKKPDKE